jgi:hypothetical protein
MVTVAAQWKMIHRRFPQYATLFKSSRFMNGAPRALQTTNIIPERLDQCFVTAVIALMLSGGVSIVNNTDNIGQNTKNRDSGLSSNVADCETKNQATSHWNSPGTVKDFMSKSGQPRNVMLHRMRSARARNLEEKYDIAWDTKLGEGAYGSVYPGRLSATGEKVCRFN